MIPAENNLYTPESVAKSLKFLTDALNWQDTPNFITFNSFVMPTEVNTEIEFDWDNTITIPRQAFLAQLHYDLAAYYFFKENYSVAIPYLISTKHYMQNIEKDVEFLSVKSSTLEGFLIATNSKNGHIYNLTKQLKISVVNQFVVMFNIKLE